MADGCPTEVNHLTKFLLLPSNGKSFLEDELANFVLMY